MNDLLEMLRYKRPKDSKEEREFVQRFIIDPNPGAKADPWGNVIIEVGEGSTTLFSCHTDTVHAKGGMQPVCADIDMGMVYKDDGEPLGADDGAGCWLMLQMIQAGVPGVYIFHYGEERGGIGSGDKAHKEPKFFERFKRAVAFDRKAEASVITHQGGDRCCSDAFGEALAAALNATGHDLAYELDDGGVFTDTANYMWLVPECTNLSVGYYDEHRPSEMLNIDHLARLTEACKLVDWEALPATRDPVAEYEEYQRGYSSWWRWRDEEDTVTEPRDPLVSQGLDWEEDLEMRAEEIMQDYGEDIYSIAERAAQLEIEQMDLLDELRELREFKKNVMTQRERKKAKKKQRAEKRAQQALSTKLGTVREARDRAADVFEDEEDEISKIPF